MLELGAQQVGDGDQVAGGCVALGACLGRLDLRVHGLDETVAQTAAEVLQDSGPVLAHGGAQTLERGQATAARPTDPAIQQGAGVLRRRSCRVQVPQRFLQPPGACGLQVAALQPVHGAHLLIVPASGVLLQRPAGALQVRLGLDLGPTHLVQRLAGQGHHVERVKGQARLRKVRGRPGHERLGHVQTHVADRSGIATMRLQIICERLERRRVAAGRGEQQPPGIGIMEQGDIALAAPAAGLVHAHPTDRAVVLLLARPVDVMAQQPPDAVVRYPHQPGHVRHRHGLAQRDHERLHHQREPRSGSCPRRLDLAGLAARRAGHPWQPGIDEGLELEEVQMLPTALDPVVDRLVRCPAGRTGQPLGLAVDGEVDGALRLPEIDRGDRPRRTQTQSLCEELFHRPRLPGTLPSGKSHPTQIAIDPNCALKKLIILTHHRYARPIFTQ